MVKASAVDHICIAVKDPAQAHREYEERLGLELSLEYMAERGIIKVARYYLREVARFIKRRTEGIFLSFYRMPVMEQALAGSHGRGEKIIVQKPRELMGNRYAFSHPPGELCGVLTEILDGNYDPKQ